LTSSINPSSPFIIMVMLTTLIIVLLQVYDGGLFYNVRFTFFVWTPAHLDDGHWGPQKEGPGSRAPGGRPLTLWSLECDPRRKTPVVRAPGQPTCLYWGSKWLISKECTRGFLLEVPLFRRLLCAFWLNCLKHVKRLQLFVRSGLRGSFAASGSPQWYLQFDWVSSRVTQGSWDTSPLIMSTSL
jgi:hypothetical protein